MINFICNNLAKNKYFIIIIDKSVERQLRYYNKKIYNNLKILRNNSIIKMIFINYKFFIKNG